MCTVDGTRSMGSFRFSLLLQSWSYNCVCFKTCCDSRLIFNVRLSEWIFKYSSYADMVFWCLKTFTSSLFPRVQNKYDTVVEFTEWTSINCMHVVNTSALSKGSEQHVLCFFVFTAITCNTTSFTSDSLSYPNASASLTVSQLVNGCCPEDDHNIWLFANGAPRVEMKCTSFGQKGVLSQQPSHCSGLLCCLPLPFDLIHSSFFRFFTILLGEKKEFSSKAALQTDLIS